MHLLTCLVFLLNLSWCNLSTTLPCFWLMIAKAVGVSSKRITHAMHSKLDQHHHPAGQLSCHE